MKQQEDRQSDSRSRNKTSVPPNSSLEPKRLLRRRQFEFRLEPNPDAVCQTLDNHTVSDNGAKDHKPWTCSSDEKCGTASGISKNVELEKGQKAMEQMMGSAYPRLSPTTAHRQASLRRWV